MTREEEILKERLKKINELKRLKINPYPYSFEQKNFASEIAEKFKNLKPEQKTKAQVKVAGRILSTRLLGKINFAHLQDSSGKIQVIVEEKVSGKKIVDFFSKYVDAGDIVGVEGTVMKTKRGELSILVQKLEILTKTLKPLPEKWHGLQDKEERYRKRYLDLITNPEVKEVFLKREKVINALREFMKSRGFIEVETPALQPVYGGAEARPFKTHLHDLKIDMYLSISPELYLKRLIVGGFDKVFTISRNFRNEGIDRTHNPEFTMMECYQTYADYNEIMRLFEQLYESACKKIHGKTKINYQNIILDFKAPWKRMTFYEALKKYAGMNESTPEKELLKKAKEFKIENVEKMPRGTLAAEIFKRLVEPNLIQPTIITDHPKETSPLCKLKRTNPDLIERFEPFCMGMELGNAYSEETDPVRQRQLLEEQAKQLRAGKAEAHPMDEDFVNAIETGMPPTGGCGIGIDRMTMLLTNSPSIRDVILFPFMKPE